MLGSLKVKSLELVQTILPVHSDKTDRSPAPNQNKSTCRADVYEFVADFANFFGVNTFFNTSICKI